MGKMENGAGSPRYVQTCVWDWQTLLVDTYGLQTTCSVLLQVKGGALGISGEVGGMGRTYKTEKEWIVKKGDMLNIDTCNSPSLDVARDRRAMAMCEVWSRHQACISMTMSKKHGYAVLTSDLSSRARTITLQLQAAARFIVFDEAIATKVLLKKVVPPTEYIEFPMCKVVVKLEQGDSDEQFTSTTPLVYSAT